MGPCLRVRATAACLLLASAVPREALAAKPAAAPSVGEQFAPWGYDLTAIDKAIAPGNDFFGYANGAWLARTTIPPDRSSAGNFVMLAELSETRVHGILEDAAAHAAAAPTAGPEKIGAFYRAFMDEARVDALDGKPLGPDLARVRAATDRRAIAALMGSAQSNFQASVFSLSIDADQKDTRRYAVYLGQGAGGLPDRDEYLAPQFAAKREAYRKFVAGMLAMAGWPDPDRRAGDILAFETEIARASWTRADRRDPVRTYNPEPVAELARTAPGFDWSAYLAAAGLPHLDRIVLQEKSAVTAIAAIVGRTDIGTLQAWAAFHLATNAAPVLSKRFDEANFDFYGRVLEGQPQQRARWKRAVAAVDSGMGEAIGQVYVARFFPPASKARMENLVGDLKQAFQRRLETVTWMDKPTRDAALRKLAKLDVQIGYPKKWRDYGALVIRADDLYGDVERAGAFEWQYQVDRLARPVDRDEWDMTPQTVNAYNQPVFDEVVFPASILQPPFFNPAADAAVNYGAIGGVIGHEMTHSFDDQGRHFDENGNLRDWWTPASARRFQALADRLGAQFDAMEMFRGLHINGRLTMGENIADLGGLNLALDAYHHALAGRPAPVVGGMTGDQRVFLGWAQAFRAKFRDDAAKQRLVVDPHSPPRARVNGPVHNIDAWYAAFAVKPGDKLYLPPAQRVRIW